MTHISTTNSKDILPYLKKLHLPGAVSHKGQNGKVLVIGGSSLFHSAVLWSAEAVSHIVDMVHVASTEENNEIIKKIKTNWQGGMVVPQRDISHYAKEDDVILVGNGMMRIGDEGELTKRVVKDLIDQFPDKQFVFDAGALQMMDKNWLRLLRTQAIITPHQKEFQMVFGEDLHEKNIEEKEEVVLQNAQEYHCTILLKAVDDVISDGAQSVTIQGGNVGLTKGGTGDILAGITAGLCTKSDPFTSAVTASFILKKTADELFKIQGNWYTPSDILKTFPQVFHSLTLLRD